MKLSTTKEIDMKKRKERWSSERKLAVARQPMYEHLLSVARYGSSTVEEIVEKNKIIASGGAGKSINGGELI